MLIPPSSDNVPKDRIAIIESFGAKVELGPRAVSRCANMFLMPTQELQNLVAVRKEGYHFVHPFDDPLLFEGYGSCGSKSCKI